MKWVFSHNEIQQGMTVGRSLMRNADPAATRKENLIRAAACFYGEESAAVAIEDLCKGIRAYRALWDKDSCRSAEQILLTYLDDMTEEMTENRKCEFFGKLLDLGESVFGISREEKYSYSDEMMRAVVDLYADRSLRRAMEVSGRDPFREMDVSCGDFLLENLDRENEVYYVALAMWHLGRQSGMNLYFEADQILEIAAVTAATLDREYAWRENATNCAEKIKSAPVTKKAVFLVKGILRKLNEACADPETEDE